MIEIALQKVSVGTVLALAFLGVMSSVFAVYVVTVTLSNTGRLRVVGVSAYWESNCINEVSSIDWGSLDPGETKDVTIFLRNEGTVDIVLNMTTDNWVPSMASSYITLQWNCENYVLTPGAVVSATLSLSVSSNISGVSTFSFDIIITGTEQT